MQHLYFPKIEVREIPQIPIISFPGGDILNDEMHALTNYLHLVNNTFFTKHISTIVLSYHTAIQSFFTQIDAYFINLEIKSREYNERDISLLLSKIQGNYLTRSKRLINDLQNETLQNQISYLQKGIEYVTIEIEHLTDHLPQLVEIIYDLDSLKIQKKDSLSQRSFKILKRAEYLATDQPVKYTVRFKKIVASHFPADGYTFFYDVLYKWGLAGVDFISNLQNLFREIRQSLTILENEIGAAYPKPEFVQKERQRIAEEFKKLMINFEDDQQTIYNYAYSRVDDILRRIDNKLAKVNANQAIVSVARRKYNNRKASQLLGNAEKWLCRNHSLLYNAALLDVSFLSFEARLKKIFADTTHDIEKAIKTSVIKNLIVFNTHLNVWIKELEKNPASKFVPEKFDFQNTTDTFHSFYREILENAMKNIKYVIGRFPETLDIMSDHSYNNLDKSQFDNIEVIHISVMRFLDYMIQDELIVPLQAHLSKLPETMDKVTHVVNDITHLIAFITQHPDEQTSIIGSEPSTINLPVFLREQHTKITEQIESTKTLYQTIVSETSIHLNLVLEKMNQTHFQKLAKSFKQSEKFWLRRKKSIFQNRVLQNIISELKFQYDKLWFRQSEAMLAARRLKRSESYNHARVSDILNLFDEVNISPETLKKIPFYYQQLFLRKQNYYNEFWVGRQHEILLAKKILHRYHQGFAGGILVTGEPGSGKTFFSKYISLQFATNANIYYLFPPVAGSISKDDFFQALQKVIGINANTETIFNKIPHHSVIVIDDLELWWEKSENGMQVVDLIIDIIDKYSKKCLFIVNINHCSFDLINRIRKIDNYFIGIIELEPFSAQDLKKIITIRQNASGLQLRLQNSKKQLVKPFDLAGLFAKFFIFSKGNPGMALYAWMANITDCNDKAVTVRTPKLPDISVLENFETIDLMLLALFILHKHLNIEKLERIMLISVEVLNNKMNYLKRSGLIIEDNKQIFELNPFLTMHIQNKLVQLEIL
jgi:hypothetical protein